MRPEIYLDVVDNLNDRESVVSPDKIKMFSLTSRLFLSPAMDWIHSFALKFN